MIDNIVNFGRIWCIGSVAFSMDLSCGY